MNNVKHRGKIKGKKQMKTDDEDEDGNVIGEVLSEWTKENFPSPIRAAATNEHWERGREMMKMKLSLIIYVV